jgi:hypothetical protein
MTGNDQAIAHVAQVLQDRYGNAVEGWDGIARVAVEALLDHVYQNAMAQYQAWVMSLPDGMDHRKH